MNLLERKEILENVENLEKYLHLPKNKYLENIRRILGIRKGLNEMDNTVVMYYEYSRDGNMLEYVGNDNKVYLTYYKNIMPIRD